MILFKTVAAYMAVQAMMEQTFPYKTAHALLMMKRALQPHAEFFSGEEMKLVETFADKDIETGNIVWLGKGTFRFAAGKNPEEYTKKRMELSMLEIEWEHKKIKAPIPSSITPAQIEALEDFIEFEEEEK